MIRLLLLLGLPLGVYAYWRFISKAPAEQRAQRIQAALFGLVSLVVMAVALRRGSPLTIGLAALGLAVWNWTMRHRARNAKNGGNDGGGHSTPPPSGGGGGGTSDRTMSPARALEILGLAPGADRDQIQQRYRQLMQNVHPDKGGSDYLAAQINLARDVLLRSGGSRPR
jgi:DnaJ domain